MLPVVLTIVFVKHGKSGTHPELLEARPGVPTDRGSASHPNQASLASRPPINSLPRLAFAVFARLGAAVRAVHQKREDLAAPLA